MLTRSQTRISSNKSINSEVPIPKNKVMPMPKSKPEPVATQQRMTTRSQARQVEEDETEVITLHVNPSKNRRIVPDDNDNLPRRSSRISINFDEASKAWRSNKRSLGNGQFEYI
jgi:hypothetical protein